jgi:hypothetical protein
MKRAENLNGRIAEPEAENLHADMFKGTQIGSRGSDVGYSRL